MPNKGRTFVLQFERTRARLLGTHEDDKPGGSRQCPPGGKEGILPELAQNTPKSPWYVGRPRRGKCLVLLGLGDRRDLFHTMELP